MDVSRAIPHLIANGVRPVGIGLETLGLDEFVEGEFWKGELYVDEGKAAYKALTLDSVSLFTGLKWLVFNPNVRKAIAATKTVPGNMKGDGLQLGATLALEKGGACLLDYRQKDFADHPTAEQVLEAFGLDPSVLETTPAEGI